MRGRVARSHKPSPCLRIATRTRTGQPSRFLEAINASFQIARRKTCGYGNFFTIRIAVIIGKPNFGPHAI